MSSSILQHDAAATLQPVSLHERSLTSQPLVAKDEAEALEFLAARPLHTVFLTGFIRDNGMVSPMNRGTFYGARNEQGQLEGVALIGNATLIESRTEAALAAFARLAQQFPHITVIL